MKQNTFISTLALVAIAILTACGSDELPADPSFDQDIKTELVDKSQLPEWLTSYINYLEYDQIHNSQEPQNVTKGVYRFEWLGRTFYELYSPAQSTVYSNMYTEDGMPIELTVTYYKTFSDLVKHWTIVYLLNPTDQMPKNIIYPVTTQTQEDNDTLIQRMGGLERKFYLVNSEEQLRNLFGKSDGLPQIDFVRYSLVLGRCTVPDDFKLKRQEIDTNGQVPVLKTYFEREMIPNQIMHVYNSDYYPRPVWSLFPKLPFETGEVETILNNSIYTTTDEDQRLVPPFFE